MNTYKIEAGAIVTEYEGESDKDALYNYAKDAGYKDYEDLKSQHGKVGKIEKI